MSEEGTVGCPSCPAGADQLGDFDGLLTLCDHPPKLAGHPQGPLTLELLDEMIEEMPARAEAQHKAHMEFLTNENKWRPLIMEAFARGEFDTSRTRQMIHNMKFGVPYDYCTVDESKLPRLMRLRRHLFRKTLK